MEANQTISMQAIRETGAEEAWFSAIMTSHFHVLGS
jgi:hypothetical protein